MNQELYANKICLPKRKISYGMKLGRFLNWIGLSFKIVKYDFKEYLSLVFLKPNPQLDCLKSVLYTTPGEIAKDVFTFGVKFAVEFIEKKTNERIETDILKILSYVGNCKSDILNDDFYTFVYLLANPSEITMNYKLNSIKKFNKSKPNIYYKKGN